MPLIHRDLLEKLPQVHSLESILLWGPRQVGKTTLLDQLHLNSQAFLDDLALRSRAQNDPAFFLDSLKLPTFIDEVQYAPNLFSEIKLRIDRQRRQRLKLQVTEQVKTDYFLTGSNRSLLENSVQESLAGRCSIYELHGLSVREILRSQAQYGLAEIMFRGGFPELYQRPDLSVIQYLNDYVLTFLEKDLARSAGIQKMTEFLAVLRLLSARAGQFVNMSEIAQAAGVNIGTISAWLELLHRNFIIELIPTWTTKLSKRVVKMKKLHFYDVGLCARLQGHLSAETLLNSPQAGALFEGLIFAEIMKTKSNHLRPWALHTWRTKDQFEIDFVLENGDQIILLEAKLGIQNARPLSLDHEAKKVFPRIHRQVVVTAGGAVTQLSSDTLMVPIQNLGTWLLEQG
jgi:predicted AAA+ superfamily ATPase